MELMLLERIFLLSSKLLDALKLYLAEVLVDESVGCS